MFLQKLEALKTFPRLVYITHPDEDFDNLSWIDDLFSGGIKWVQFRLKQNHFEARNPDKNYAEYFELYLKNVIEKCSNLNILVTVNDASEYITKFPSIGLHVGKEDAPTHELKSILNSTQVFGRTANNFEDVKNYFDSRIDYFGVGPYRFTNTKDKDKLSSTLGLEGYKDILAKMQNASIKTPILAIGGIQLNDISELIEIGVYGIALSGEIFERSHDSVYIRTLLNEIKKSL